MDKTRQTVKLYDKSNTLIGFYPATVGSEEKPSPSGTLKVSKVSRNPTYRYNPDYQFKGVRSNKPLAIKPGPNKPVGTVWINPRHARAWKGVEDGIAGWSAVARRGGEEDFEGKLEPRRA